MGTLFVISKSNHQMFLWNMHYRLIIKITNVHGEHDYNRIFQMPDVPMEHDV